MERLSEAVDGMKRLGVTAFRDWAAHIKMGGGNSHDGWIPVAKRLPDQGDKVLLWFKRGCGSYDIGVLGENGWRWPNGGVYQIQPTHWMPLPAPPETSK